MDFCYVLSGWECSATDSAVYDNARGKDFATPNGKYYLVDVGYPNCDQLVVPYRGVCYHLREWKQGHQQPQDVKQLFNVWHSQLWNVIKHIFGVVQKRFLMMWYELQLPITYQSKAILAMLALYNFIHANDLSDFNETAGEDLIGVDNMEYAAHTDG